MSTLISNIPSEVQNDPSTLPTSKSGTTYSEAAPWNNGNLDKSRKYR